MNRFIAAAATLIALSAAPALAQERSILTSASQITLKVLAPSLDVATLSDVQARRIDAKVASKSGLSRSDLLTILGNRKS